APASRPSRSSPVATARASFASVAVATPKAAEKNRSSRRKGFRYHREGIFRSGRHFLPADWPPWQHGNARPSVRCPEVETSQIEAASRRRRTSSVSRECRCGDPESRREETVRRAGGGFPYYP